MKKQPRWMRTFFSLAFIAATGLNFTIKMRLLQQLEDGSFDFVEATDEFTPRYAVLSHTWGKERDEVTLKDVESGTAQGRPGYHKLEFCAKQAARDNISYFWIDTCCIDKSSSAEVSEAINSMFRWYRNASICYAYLIDVSTSNLDTTEDQGTGTSWETEFSNSRWFTRGWTLQELIAPPKVVFFSKEGRRLGDKESLEDALHEVTGIERTALRGTVIAQFSISDRLRWAKDRHTKRAEDHVYCMLGILEIYLPLIYGEGRANANRRLQREIAETLQTQRFGVNMLNVLIPGYSLPVNQQLVSLNGDYKLKLNENGNLVLTGPNGFLWCSNSYSEAKIKGLYMQYDGNLVTYTQENEPVWATMTNWQLNAHFRVQDDGNAVVYSNDRPIWASHTIGGHGGPCALERRQRIIPSQFLVSCNGRFRLALQDDGDLVLARASDVLWRSNTGGSGVKELHLDKTGNLTLRGRDNKSKWSSNTAGLPVLRVELSDEGDLVLVGPSGIVWSLGTNQNVDEQYPSPSISAIENQEGRPGENIVEVTKTDAATEDEAVYSL